MTHIGKEGGLQAIGLFGTVFGINQFHLHFFSFGDNERRTDQSQWFAILIPRFNGSLGFHPFYSMKSFLCADYAIFFFYFFRMTLY